MWIMTNFGFFSVVQKRSDRDSELLTIRSRVKEDLQALKERYLPEMGPIFEGAGTDYQYRAKAAKTDFANALLEIGMDIDYDNFKDSVASNQGDEREGVYHKIWKDLRQLREID